jgi:myo-inositol-1-phosphate synthase
MSLTKSKCKVPYKAIGYTNDKEQVFMTQEGKGPEGQPMEFTLIWSPADAAGIAKLLMDAANACLNKSPIVIPGRG